MRLASSTYSDTAAGTTAGATATLPTNEGHAWIVESFSGYSDADSVIEIRDEDDNVLWKNRILLGGEAFANFSVCPAVRCAAAKGLKGVIVTSTDECQVNIGAHKARM